MADNTGARRVTNASLARAYAQLGLYVFPSSGKVPLIPRYNRADTAIEETDREAAIEEFTEKSGRPPVHVGATVDLGVIKRMWRAHPDAVPSISCGPSKLVVIDADQKDDGPRKVRALFAEIGGVPDGAVINPTRSGGEHYVFSDADSRFGNKAGQLKKTYGSDVRGVGGQFVAPGAVREDGKTYGTRDDATRFMRAIRKGLPPLPAAIAELIGQQGDPSTGDNVAETDTSKWVRHLEDVDWPEHESIFAPVELDGLYDLAFARRNNEEFEAIYSDPSGDHSRDRMKMAYALLKEWPAMPVEHLAVFFEQWEGAGEFDANAKNESGKYNLRNVARDWLRSKVLLKEQGVDETSARPSDGSAFDAVVDEEELAELERVRADLVGKMAHAGDLAYFKDPDQVVEYLCSPGQLGMIHGPSNIGKTFAVIHMGACISVGDKWFGRNVEQSGVLYLFGEGRENFRNRLAAYKTKYPKIGKGLIIHDGMPKLGTEHGKAVKELSKAIDQANAMQDAEGLPPVRVVYFDTFAKLIAGLNESDAKEVQPVLNALRALARTKGVCFVIVHHSGKDVERGARGSSAIYADVDFNLEVIGAADAKKRKLQGLSNGQLAIISPKMRDDDKSGLNAFKLDKVQVGINKWGNPVNSMVAVPIESSSGAEFDAVPEVVEDEPLDTDDELTVEQNHKLEDDRQAMLGKIRAAMATCAKRSVRNEAHATIDEIEQHIPALAKLKRDSGGNYARELRKLLFMDEKSYMTLMGDVWLKYEPGRKNNPSRLILTPK